MAVNSSGNESQDWGPVAVPERFAVLDLLRGIALFGVLLVNLLYFFRLSLFAHIFQFHSHPGWANRAIDLSIAEFVEFKCFDLFSLTFGIGIAVQAERAAFRGISVKMFLARRFLILGAFGALHMLLVSNVDILMLYAVCGLFVIPLLRLPTALLAAAGLAAVYLPSLLAGWPPLPPESVLQAHVVNATRIYGTGSFGAILQFRWQETRELLGPLLIGLTQKTVGMMLLGTAAWRAGIVREPGPYRRLLWAVCLVAGVIGIANTTAEVLSKSTGRPVYLAPVISALGSHVPLAFAYAAALLAWKRSERPAALIAGVAAVGRMAFTNYLMQSLVFALLFYGYGFQLFGRLDPVVAMGLGIVLYAAQLWFSLWWLERYRFGPLEWVWRSMTYARRQPMLRP